ncbi:hypothetical protein [Burkholderia arboris]|uniref:hypothetical protein n=1 Tax=Burkholderia arboris TaxID=488730 RepID=UPI001CF4872F|nr:hypothetical protein [Burkholderia arboris]MCA8050728.1 hypothetical protein [Burkholderia arboris]HEP6431502.1 hypothetical protein [Burkholderia cenocepacia]
MNEEYVPPLSVSAPNLPELVRSLMKKLMSAGIEKGGEEVRLTVEAVERIGITDEEFGAGCKFNPARLNNPQVELPIPNRITPFFRRYERTAEPAEYVFVLGWNLVDGNDEIDG